ncbi:MAG: DNA repair ATPase, partial [Saprospiraceae bacterium]
FDNKVSDKMYERRIASPNGEDYIYVFYNEKMGSYVLLIYNIIQQAVATPIICHGYTIFPNGELAYFKAEDEPTKHHVVQIWQTPFTAGEQVKSEHADHYLYKVGNKDIVRAMSECRQIIILSTKEDSYSDLYDDIVKKCTDVLDSYYWIDKNDAYQLDDPIRQIKQTANSAIEEYEKKIRIQRNTQEEITRVNDRATEVFKKVERGTFANINDFVDSLSELRKLRGEIISLREMRYTDLDLVERLEEQAGKSYETLSQNCVEFLLQEESLLPYQQRIQEKETAVANVKTNKEGEDLEEEINQIGTDLEMLIDIVSNLKIEDATQTTRIIDGISSMYSGLNQTKAGIKRKRKELMSTEAVAEFNAQLKLLDQG